VPAGEAAQLRCPPALAGAAAAAAHAAGVPLEVAPGEAIALVSGAWRVELGLAARVESHWGELAPRVLRALAAP
jgi:hypothetical protein